MIFTETEQVPLSAAISKHMLIHGLDFNSRDQPNKSVYMALRSDDPKSTEWLV